MNSDPTFAHTASYQNASRITTYIRPAVEQFHGALFGTYKVNDIITFIYIECTFKVLRHMPPSLFEPLEQAFINRYNARYNVQWGQEFAHYSLAYLIYIAMGSQNNYSHPGFLQTAPAQLQVNIDIL